MPETTDVVIVGAGPTGLTAALFLVDADIDVTVLESRSSIYDDPRAATFHPPTLEMFEKSGITRKLHDMGILCPRWQFRGREEGVIAEFDLGLLADITAYPYRLQCEQHKLVAAIAELLSGHPRCAIHYGATVEAVEQDLAGVSVRTADGAVHRAGFVIGADGGRSVVRKSQNIAFDGFTYEERFLVITTDFDFERLEFAYSCYVSDPRQWCALFKVPGAGAPGVWRVVFATPADAQPEQLLDHDYARRKLEGLVPGYSYAIVHTNLYTVHQRVAASYRRDRVLLAGDAAHVNNPLGGMGMNFGIHDAVDLADKIARVLRGEPDALLDVYDRQRRHVANAFLQAMTIQNKRLLEEKDASVRQQRIQEMAEIARDPEKSRAFLMRTAMFEGLQVAKQVH
jgi:3-(3-hydroxy-phenyl)propionate hydroxylase